MSALAWCGAATQNNYCHTIWVQHTLVWDKENKLLKQKYLNKTKIRQFYEILQIKI